MKTPSVLSVFVVAAVVVAGCSKKQAQPAAAPSTRATPRAVTAVTENTNAPIDGEVTLQAPPTVVAGSVISLTFTGPANSKDYIDIVPRGSTATSGELTYVYVSDSLHGGALHALGTPGDYDLRYILDLKTSRLVKVVLPLTITAATAQLTAPAQALGGEPLSIEWVGPGGERDYVDVVPKGVTQTSGEVTYAYTRDGTPAKFAAPGAPGEYSIRYVLEAPGGRKVLASSALQVTAPPATLTAPQTAVRGTSIIVEYTGPKRKGDYVDLVKKGYMPTSGEITYFYDGSANELKLPTEPGEFEIRYVMEAPGGRQVLAKRVLTVK